MPSIFQGRTHTKFILSYLAIALVILVIGLLAAIRLNQINATVSNLTNNLAANMVLSKEIVSQVLAARLSANRYIRTQNQTDLDNFQEDFSRLKTLLTQAEQQITDPRRIDLLCQIKTAGHNYGDTFNKVSALLKERSRIQSEILDVQALSIENKLTALSIRVISLNEPSAFLAIGNARVAFQLMQLNSARYMAEGDERYTVLFESSYRQVQTSFSSLQTILQEPVQHQNLSEAKLAADEYHQGFQTIHAGHVELKDTLETKLDTLEFEISNLATAVVTDIEREFGIQNTFSQTLIWSKRNWC
jgi:methyl-accepting chemotaxis protein